MKYTVSGLCAAAALALGAPAALAAHSDYLLEIPGVDGESAATIEVDSWSWGASNAVVSPRDVATGQSSGKRSHITASQNSQSLRESPTRVSTHTVTASQNTQSLRESPTRASTGGVSVAAGDVTGDGRADLMAAAAQDSITGFSLTFDKASPVLAKLCAGKHIAKANLTGRSGDFVLENVMVTSCTVPKQTQSASFGERCASGGECAATGVTVAMTGQMKHTKTGHVTLMK